MEKLTQKQKIAQFDETLQALTEATNVVHTFASGKISKPLKLKMSDFYQVRHTRFAKDFWAIRLCVTDGMKLLVQTNEAGMTTIWNEQDIATERATGTLYANMLCAGWDRLLEANQHLLSK